MKKRVLMSFVLLAVIGTSAVFAQQPTLDKLAFPTNTSGYTAIAKKDISGAVVIPDTYNGKPVTGVSTFGRNPNITSVVLPNSLITIDINAFMSDTGITSITIPASVTKIENGAFRGCTNLTSVTFLRSDITLTANPNMSWAANSFDGDLGNKYQAGGAGTYTRQAGSNNWTKQGGGFTLNGVWKRSDGMEITIADNGQTITITGNKPNNGGRLNKTYTER